MVILLFLSVHNYPHPAIPMVDPFHQVELFYFIIHHSSFIIHLSEGQETVLTDIFVC